MTAAARLRRRLTAIGLAGLLAAHRHSGIRGPALTDQRAGLDGVLATAVDLLCLERHVDVAAASAALGEEGLALLVERAVARIDDDRVRLPGTRMVEHHGALVLVGSRGSSVGGYYGPDSIGLGRLLLGAPSAERGVDLFASTGAQSLLLARAATEVTAVEIDEGLAGFFTLNAELAGVADRVRPLWGDARAVELTGPYDVAVLNAPLLPSFGLDGLATGADGGPTGHDLLAAALDRVPLAAKGVVYATATATGDVSGPDTGWLEEVAAAKGMRCTVLATGAGVLTGADASFGAELATTLAAASGCTVDEVRDRFEALRSGTGADRLHFCLIVGAVEPEHAGVSVACSTQGGARAGGWWW